MGKFLWSMLWLIAAILFGTAALISPSLNTAESIAVMGGIVVGCGVFAGMPWYE